MHGKSKTMLSTLWLLLDIWPSSLCSPTPNPRKNLEADLPKGIWRRFHFEDDNPVSGHLTRHQNPLSFDTTIYQLSVFFVRIILTCILLLIVPPSVAYFRSCHSYSWKEEALFQLVLSFSMLAKPSALILSHCWLLLMIKASPHNLPPIVLFQKDCGGCIKCLTCVLQYIFVISSGKAEGILYEDDADGFSFQDGQYLLTTYEAQQVSIENVRDGSEVVVRVTRSEGKWTRPDRQLHVRLLIGNTTEVLVDFKLMKIIEKNFYSALHFLSFALPPLGCVYKTLRTWEWLFSAGWRRGKRRRGSED